MIKTKSPTDNAAVAYGLTELVKVVLLLRSVALLMVILVAPAATLAASVVYRLRMLLPEA
jgi:hypothetical protein